MNWASGNLRKAKLRIMSDPGLKDMLMRSSWNEIVFDLDGDGNADVCFLDENGDGNIDTMGIDMTGIGEFNLYLHDTDDNGVPDMILWADDGAAELQILANGEGVEKQLIDVSSRIYGKLVADEFLNEEISVSLTELSEYMKSHLEELITAVNKIIDETGVDKVAYFLENAQTYYLATEDGDQPRVRPFGTVLVYDNKLYIQTGKSKDVFRQISTNPKAEICAFSDGRWLRVCGELVNDDTREIKEAMLEKMPQLKAMYSADDDNMQMLYFKDAVATFSSFTDAPEVIEF